MTKNKNKFKNQMAHVVNDLLLPLALKVTADEMPTPQICQTGVNVATGVD